MRLSSQTADVPPCGGADAPAGAERPSRSDDVRAAQLMAAIEAVYRERFSTFHRVATAITGSSEAGRDAVQEAFARAIRWRRDFHGEGALEGWVWRTVVNVAKDHRRAASGGERCEDLAELPDTSGRGGADHPQAAIRQRVAALPDRQRVALFLRYYVDMSYAEIGEVLEIRTGTVSATLNAAHRALRISLEGVLAEDAALDDAGPRVAPAASARRRRRPLLPMSACVGARASRCRSTAN